MSVEIKLSFEQIMDLVKQLPDEEQVMLLSELKDHLEEKGLVKWNDGEDGRLNYLLARSIKNQSKKELLAPLLDEDEEFSDEEEIEMTDEEFIKAVKEMS